MDVRQAIAVSALILCVAAADPAVAEEGKACPLGTQTQKAGGLICVPREPRNWVVCSGITDSRGATLWKDTGVPCDRPPPRSPAEYQPVTEIPHPPHPPPDSKRVIDLFRGLWFVCHPAIVARWTTEACAQITREWVRQAEAGKARYIALSTSDTVEVAHQKGEAAGIPFGSELQWGMTFKAQENGDVYIRPTLTGVVEVVPGIYTRRAIIVGSDINMDARQARTANAVDAAKALSEGWFRFLLDPN